MKKRISTIILSILLGLGEASAQSIKIAPGNALKIAPGSSVKLQGSVAAPTLTVGSRDIIYDHSTLASSPLTQWPDGTMGVDKNSSVYTFWSPNGGSGIGRMVGTLDAPKATSATPLSAAAGIPGDLGYYAGGPVYRVDGSTLLMFVHTEKYPGSGYYTQLAMAKSTNNGTNWTHLGHIISPTVTYAQYPTCGCHFDLGSGPYLVIGPYIYVYSSDFRTDGSIQYITVARALLSDVLTAAASNTVTSFFKYHGGTWTEPGMGGLSDALEAGNGIALFHTVAFNSLLNKYLLVSMNFGSGFSNFDILESTDGLAWSNRQQVANEGGVVAVYSTLIGTGSDPLACGATCYVYFMYSVAESTGGAGARYSDHVLVRRLLSWN